MARNNAIANATFETIQSAIYGPNEPDSDVNLGDALNWYSGMKATSDARDYLLEYLAAQKRKDDIVKLRNVPDCWISNTIGWLARLAVNGYPVPDSSLEFLERKLKETLKHSEFGREGYDQTAKTFDLPTQPNIQQRIRDKASELIAGIEGDIDDGLIGPGISLYNHLRAQQVSAVVANKLAEHFRPIAEELTEVSNTSDKDLKEAYRKYSSAELKNLATIYINLFADAVRYAANAKKAPKPRAKKKPSMEKLLQHFQYQKSDESLKLVSIDSAKIIGAKELWTYNTKSKLLSVFRANDSDGLNVRRSTIINVDDRASKAKRIGRKTEERLHSVLTGGAIVRRNLMDEIAGSFKSVSRIGKTTVLLRVL